MMRALAFAVLVALPASAQDFRGVWPGDPIETLGPIGEPLDILPTDTGRRATYPLPFAQRLTVDYDSAQGIRFVQTYASGDAPEPPQTDGLQFGITLHRAARRMGLGRADLATPGLLYVSPFAPGGFTLLYDVPDDENVLLALDFVGERADILAVPARGRLAALGDADLTAAFLLLRSEADAIYPPADAADGPRAAPIPFPIPIDEAFPSLIP